MMGNSTLTKSKQHFLVLDGLRGIAAISVVVFHFAEWIFASPVENFIGHGFLAVDFFFCLSGFVIAYAYDSRMDALGIGSFFKLRLIRLHPLVILGAVLSFLGFLFDPFSNELASYSVGTIGLLLISSLLLIPLPIMESRFFNVFGWNAPAWSLFWEYVANIVYALILRKLHRTILLGMAVIAAVGICMVANTAGNLVGGWNDETFWHGGVRVAYSFLAGMVLYRFNWIIKNNLGFLGLTLLLLPVFLFPFSNEWNKLTEPLVVLLYCPLLVSLGAGTTLSEKAKPICTFSGAISYPLYMVHYGFIWIFGHYVVKYNPDTTTLTFIIIIGTILLVAFSWLVMKWYDTPLRKYLHRRWVK
ncbi:MAG TPA: acyltransferase [Phnomibacter sp.]|nr:acyltransferase [Phnomibacter sp.]